MERTLIEREEYRYQIETLGGFERMDDVLRGVTWALSTNPEVYDVIKGTKDIRILKTDALGGLPALRVWFRIDEDGQRVHLEYIEAVEPDA